MFGAFICRGIVVKNPRDESFPDADDWSCWNMWTNINTANKLVQLTG